MILPVSYPLIFVIGIVAYIALASFALFFFRRDRLEHLHFALLACAVLVYDLCSLGLYNSRDVAAALWWQHGQLISISLVAGACVPFIFSFLNLPRTRAANVFMAAFLIGAVIAALPLPSVLDPAQVTHRTWHLGSVGYDHYEASPGVVTQAAYLVMVLGMIYGTSVAARHALQHRLRYQVALVLGLSVFFLSAVSDILIGIRLFSFAYTLEYSFVSMVVLMNYSLISRFAYLARMAGQKRAELEGLVETRTAHIQNLMSQLDAQNRRLEQVAATDGLTGLLSRAAFEQRLKAAFNAASRHRFPFALVMIDIDDFKSYNDTFGHPFGDEVICSVADVLRNTSLPSQWPPAAQADKVPNLRDYDVAGRYGGDEFVVVLMYCGKAEAELVASRLVNKIRAISFAEHPEIRVTPSVGVACMAPGTRCESPEQLLIEADRALYRAKHAGKNQHFVVSVASAGEQV